MSPLANAHTLTGLLLTKLSLRFATEDRPQRPCQSVPGPRRSSTQSMRREPWATGPQGPRSTAPRTCSSNTCASESESSPCAGATWGAGEAGRRGPGKDIPQDSTWRRPKWRGGGLYLFISAFDHAKCEGSAAGTRAHTCLFLRKDDLCLTLGESIQAQSLLCQGCGFGVASAKPACVTGCPSPSTTGGSLTSSQILKVLLLMLGNFICSWIHFYILSQLLSVCFKQKLILGMTQAFQMQEGAYPHIRLSFKQKELSRSLYMA